jgi:hypothetical protein
MEDKFDTLDDLNLMCVLHNSPIGGVCSDLKCAEYPLLCVFCAVDENSCLRKLNHEMITFEEFFIKYEKHLNKKEDNDLSLIDTLTYIKSLDINKIKKEYDEGFEKKVTQMQQLANQFKAKILKNAENELEENAKRITNESEVSTKFLKQNSNIFDILSYKLDDRLEAIKKKYSDFKNLKIDIQNNSSEIEYTGSDYHLLNSLICLNKRCKEPDFNKKAQVLVEILKQTNLAQDNKQYDDFLYSLELLVPKIFSNFLDESSNSNHKRLNKYLNSYSSEVFSYVEKELFNTTLKYELCSNSPIDLKFKKKFTNLQNKNTLPDMICTFKAKDGKKYLLLSCDGKIGYLDFTYNFDGEINFIQENIGGIVFKFEHYADDKNDYIVFITSERTLAVYNYEKNEFKLREKIKITARAYTFEIIAVDNKPTIIVPSYKSSILEYSLTNLNSSLSWDIKIPTYTYSLKAFYHNKLKKYFLLASTHVSLMLIDYEAKKEYMTITNDSNKWNLCSLVIPSNKLSISNKIEDDYYIISNIQCNLDIFSFNTGKIIKSMETDKTISYRGLDIWNEKYLIIGNDKKKAEIYNIETGKLEKALNDHTKSVAGCKRYKDNNEEYLFTYSLDGSLNLYSY